MRSATAIVIVCAVAACHGADNATPPAVTRAPLAAPTRSAAAPRGWSLTLASDYGPCSDDDPRPCHSTWSATAAGVVTRTDQPNSPSGHPRVTERALSPTDRDQLAGLVANPEFIAGMAHGFPCQGGGSDPDATLRLSFDRPDAAPTQQQQHIEHCARGGDHGDGDPTLLVNRILRLLGR